MQILSFRFLPFSQKHQCQVKWKWPCLGFELVFLLPFLTETPLKQVGKSRLNIHNKEKEISRTVSIGGTGNFFQKAGCLRHLKKIVNLLLFRQGGRGYVYKNKYIYIYGEMVDFGKILFANVSHQTKLDTRSKAWRPIKMGIKGRGMSGTSQGLNPAGLMLLIDPLSAMWV